MLYHNSIVTCYFFTIRPYLIEDAFNRLINVKFLNCSQSLNYFGMINMHHCKEYDPGRDDEY